MTRYKKRIVKKSLFPIALLCLLGLQVPHVYADGIYYPRETVYKKAPIIPSQRAILVYKDGVEKLLIESALEGEGEEFAWIMPLPSKPIEFEKASPGFLKTLSLGTLQPLVTHDLEVELADFSVIAATITVGFVLVLLTKANRTVEFLVVIFIAFFILTMTRGSLSRSGVENLGPRANYVTVEGVSVADAQEIGSYGLVVLEAERADALDDWLVTNGFVHLSGKDKPIVSEYIRDGWFFVAAKLRREAGGYSRPHPLAMTFQSKIPVYPIRLTSTAGSDVYLELFVIADERATSSRLPLEVSDTYMFKDDIGSQDSRKKPTPGFVGGTYRWRIAHPETAKYMWDSCTLSKLCGTLRPSQMHQDITLNLAGTEPYLRRYYSRQGASQTGLIFALNAWWMLLIGLTVLFNNDIRRKGRIFGLVRIVVPSALLCLVLWGATFAVIPKVEVESESDRATRAEYWGGDYRQTYEREAIVRGFDNFEGVPDEQVGAQIADFLNFTDYRNPLTGERVTYEDSPGNLTVFRNEQGIALRAYFRDGFWTDYPLVPTAYPKVYARQQQKVDALFLELMDATSEGHPREVIKESFNLSAFGRAYMLVKTYRLRPMTLVPILIRDLQARQQELKGESTYTYRYQYNHRVRKIRYEASMLACVARVEPPADVTNSKKMGQFIENIEAWYNSVDKKR